MARYRKVDIRIWSDAKVRQLSEPAPNGQTLWFRLLTGEHTGLIPGLSRTGEAALAEQVGWPLAAFRRCFAEVEALGMVVADWGDRVLWLPNAIRYNEPENPNQVKAWRTTWGELPDGEVKAAAWERFDAYMVARDEARAAEASAAGKEAPKSSFAATFRAACPKPCMERFRKRSGKRSGERSGEGSANGSRNKEKEQEQEKDFARSPRAGAREGENQAATSPPSPGERVAGDDGGTHESTDGGRDAAPSGDARAALGPEAPAEGGPPTPAAPRTPLAAAMATPLTPGYVPPGFRRPEPAEDDAPAARAPLLVVDTTELPEPAARVRGELERRLGYGVDLAPGFADEVERLGEERALEVFAREAADYLARNPGQRIQSLAFFVTVGKRYHAPAAPRTTSCREWEAVLAALKALPPAERLLPETVENWLRPLDATLENGVLRLTAPDEGHAAFVVENYVAGLRRLASKELGGLVPIEVNGPPLQAAGGGA